MLRIITTKYTSLQDAVNTSNGFGTRGLCFKIPFMNKVCYIVPRHANFSHVTPKPTVIINNDNQHYNGLGGNDPVDNLVTQESECTNRNPRRRLKPPMPIESTIIRTRPTQNTNKTWVNGFTRNGRHVNGYWRNWPCTQNPFNELRK